MKKIKINKKRLILLLVIVNLLIIGVGGTLSAYRSNGIGKATIGYAAIVFNNEEVNSINIDLTSTVPGVPKIIDFNVGNYSGSKKSDVTINYKLIVKSYGLVPASLVIKDKNTNTEILNCNGSTGSRDDTGLFICESTVQEMSHSSNKMYNYEAIATITEGTPEGFSRQADYFEIIIDSWQKQS